jgi:hypothetical protein
MNIEFEIQKSDSTKHSWSFYVNGSELILDLFLELERPTGKRKWNKVRGYQRIRWNGCGNTMDINEVPWTVEIRNMARDKFIEAITVRK